MQTILRRLSRGSISLHKAPGAGGRSHSSPPALFMAELPSWLVCGVFSPYAQSVTSYVGQHGSCSRPLFFAGHSREDPTQRTVLHGSISGVDAVLWLGQWRSGPIGFASRAAAAGAAAATSVPSRRLQAYLDGEAPRDTPSPRLAPFQTNRSRGTHSRGAVVFPY